MPPPPPCSDLGAHCRSLPVTLRIGAASEGEESLDHEATWLLGHTGQIDFSNLRPENGDVLVDAVLHVRCTHLKAERGRDRCAAHGFSRPAAAPGNRVRQLRRLGNDRFGLVGGLQWVEQTIEAPAAHPHALPVLNGDNPCAGARCRTADNLRGAACCRDLQIEILCPPESSLEALVRARQSPYLCKIERKGDRSLDAEMISACGYLADDVTCSLHGRRRANGRPAKPDLCSDWPPKGQGEHPGCVFGPVLANGVSP